MTILSTFIAVVNVDITRTGRGAAKQPLSAPRHRPEKNARLESSVNANTYLKASSAQARETKLDDKTRRNKQKENNLSSASSLARSADVRSLFVAHVAEDGLKQTPPNPIPRHNPDQNDTTPVACQQTEKPCNPPRVLRRRYLNWRNVSGLKNPATRLLRLSYTTNLPIPRERVAIHSPILSNL
ncbi:unnamed protein product [Ectocarpus sp. 8 AP-2014]